MTRPSPLQVALIVLAGVSLIAIFTMIQMKKLDPGVAALHLAPKTAWAGQRTPASEAGPLFAKKPLSGCPCSNKTEKSDDFHACFSCVQKTAIAMQDSVLSQFGNFDVDFTTTIDHNGETLVLSTKSSGIPEFERQVQLNSESGEVCLSVFYSQHQKYKDKDSVKSLTHYNSAACKDGEAQESVAFVMALDRYYSGHTEKVELFQMTKHGQEFNLQNEVSDAVYINTVEKGSQIDKSAYLLGQGKAWGFYTIRDRNGLSFAKQEQLKISERAKARRLASRHRCFNKDALVSEKLCKKLKRTSPPLPKVELLAKKDFPAWTQLSTTEKVESHFASKN